MPAESRATPWDRASAEDAAADDHPAAADEAAALAHRANPEHAGPRIEPPLPDHAADDAGRAQGASDDEARPEVLADDGAEADARARPHDDPAADPIATPPALLEALAPIRPAGAVATLDVAAAVGTVPAFGARRGRDARPSGTVPAVGAVARALLAELLAALPARRSAKLFTGAARADVLRRGCATQRQKGTDAEASQKVVHDGIPELGQGWSSTSALPNVPCLILWAVDPPPPPQHGNNQDERSFIL